MKGTLGVCVVLLPLLALFLAFDHPGLIFSFNTVTLQGIHYLSRPHDGILRQPLLLEDHQAAWTRDSLVAESAPGWEVQVSSADAAELASLARALAAKFAPPRSLAELSAGDFTLSDGLKLSVDAWVRATDPARGGRGFVMLRGLADIEPLGDDGQENATAQAAAQAAGPPLTAREAEFLFYALGLTMGLPGAQNRKSELLGHVRLDRAAASDYRAENRAAAGSGSASSHAPSSAASLRVRQFLTDERIEWHCDAADLVGLLALHQSQHGGASRLASSVSVYNEFLRRRPDLVDALYQPWALDTRGDGGLRWIPVQPVAAAGGLLRTFWHREYFRTAHEYPEAPAWGSREFEAYELYNAIADEPALILETRMERGDALFTSNHVVLHARTAYSDERRHLLRLWLTTEDYGTGLALKLRAWQARLRTLGRLVRAKITQR